MINKGIGVSEAIRTIKLNTRKNRSITIVMTFWNFVESE